MLNMTDSQIQYLLFWIPTLISLLALYYSYIAQKVNYPIITDAFIEFLSEDRGSIVSCNVSSTQPILIYKAKLIQKKPRKILRKSSYKLIPRHYSIPVGDHKAEFDLKQELNKNDDYFLKVVTNLNKLSMKNRPLKRIINFSSSTTIKVKIVDPLDLFDGTFKSLEDSK